MGIIAKTRALTPGEYAKLGLKKNRFINVLSPKPHPYPGKLIIYNPVKKQKEVNFDDVFEWQLNANPPLSVWFGVSFTRTYEGVELALVTCVFPVEEDVL